MAALPISRRGLFKAAGAAAPIAAAIGVLSGCVNSEQKTTENEPVVVDEGSAVSILDEFEQVDDLIHETGSYTLPLGNVLRPNDGNWISATTAGESAAPPVKGSVLSLTSGQLFEVVPTPVSGPATTKVIYDTRCSERLYAWLELDIITRGWTLLASRMDNGVLEGDTTTLWEADANWDPATFAVADNAVLWQVMPALSGNKTAEHSFCYLWRTGDAEATPVVESPGRFALAPTLSSGIVLLAPRVRADEGVFYGLSAYTVDNDLKTLVDQLVLPASVKPFRAAYVGTRFAVSIEASYESGGLLGKMGTYFGRSDSDDFFMLGREPFADIVGKGDIFVVKVRASYVVIDLERRKYSILAAQDRSLDYGEYPARAGETNSFVTYATVKDEVTGYPLEVKVRSFALR